MILGIFGAGGLGSEVLDTVKSINSKSYKWEEIIFIEEFPKKSFYLGHRLYSSEDLKKEFNLPEDQIRIELIIAFGEIEHRQRIYDVLKGDGFKFAKIIHPSSIVSENSTIADGVVIQSLTLISSGVNIGENTFIHPHCVIGHGINVGQHSMISACVSIGGNTSIGKSCFIGLNSALFQSIIVGDYCVIAAGSVLSIDLDSRMIVAGNPARIISKNTKDTKIFWGLNEICQKHTI